MKRREVNSFEYSATSGPSPAELAEFMKILTVSGWHKGYVHGRTTNGGVSIELAGDRWEGHGLDVTTTNGGVNLRVPRNYSAQLEAHTNNGGIHADLPQLQTQPGPGTRSHDISTTLGTGGAILKVATTNGGVSLRRT